MLPPPRGIGRFSHGLPSFGQIGQFKGLSSLGTWLHRIVVNAALGRLRSLLGG